VEINCVHELNNRCQQAKVSKWKKYQTRIISLKINNIELKHLLAPNAVAWLLEVDFLTKKTHNSWSVYSYCAWFSTRERITLHLLGSQEVDDVAVSDPIQAVRVHYGEEVADLFIRQPKV